MKKPKMKPISIVAGIVFAIALTLNIQSNVSGVGILGKQLFAQSTGAGSGSGGGGEKVQNCTIYENDEVVGQGNTCKPGEANCVSNPCE